MTTPARPDHLDTWDDPSGWTRPSARERLGRIAVFVVPILIVVGLGLAGSAFDGGECGGETCFGTSGP